MTVELNHTIVTAQDRWAGAQWLAEILGLPEPTANGPFAAVQLTNNVTLDYLDGTPVPGEHYAFLIDDGRLDQVAARLAERGVPTYADPGHRTPGQNTMFGGRGFYFDSPDGHNLEVLTRAS
jgi:hypothetical protein